MSIRRLRCPMIAALLLLPALLAAQVSSVDQTLSGTLGLTRTKSDGSGMSVTGTYSLGNRFVSFGLAPLDLVFVPGKGDSNYESQTFSNGTTVCRDLRNGQFAEKSHCNPATRILYAASAHLEGAMPIGNNHWVTGGVGSRAGSGDGPFGTVAFMSAPINAFNWSVRLRGSREFLDVALGASMPLAAGKRPSHPESGVRRTVGLP